jgi:hypothetical protein
MLQDLSEDDEIEATILDWNPLEVANIGGGRIPLVDLFEVSRFVSGVLKKALVGSITRPGIQDQGPAGNRGGEGLDFV